MPNRFNQTWKVAWSPRGVPLRKRNGRQETMSYSKPLDLSGYYNPTKKGCIYLVKSKRYNFWKLGYTKNIKNRIKNLEQGCPFRLHLVYAIEASQSEEKKLHKSLKDYQIKGEWYQFRGCESKVKDMMDQFDIDKEIEAVYGGLVWEATQNHENGWKYPLSAKENKLNYTELREQAISNVLEVRDLLITENEKYYKKCKLLFKKKR